MNSLFGPFKKISPDAAISTKKSAQALLIKNDSSYHFCRMEEHHEHPTLIYVESVCDKFATTDDERRCYENLHNVWEEIDKSITYIDADVPMMLKCNHRLAVKKVVDSYKRAIDRQTQKRDGLI